MPFPFSFGNTLSLQSPRPCDFFFFLHDDIVFNNRSGARPRVKVLMDFKAHSMALTLPPACLPEAPGEG